MMLLAILLFVIFLLAALDHEKHKAKRPDPSLTKEDGEPTTYQRKWASRQDN